MIVPTQTTTESAALMETLTAIDADAPTACTAWRAHDIAAHLAAGLRESADLVEHRLSGLGDRETRDFEEREAPVRALDHDVVLEMIRREGRRKNDAWNELEARGETDLLFTGARFDRARIEIHSRSEAALHRWDMVGDDDVSRRLLAQPDLLAHGVWVLDHLPVLNESAEAIGMRARLAEPTDIAFRTEGEPDVVLTLGPTGSRFALVEEATNPSLVLTLEAHHRPLVLWGRRPATMAPGVDGDRDLLAMLERVMWPDATPWA